MASDGDLYHMRRVMGFCKAFNAAVQNGSVEEEAAAILAAMKRALRGEFRIGAFRKMVTATLRTVAEHEAGLFAADSLACERMIGYQLDAIERLYSDGLTTHETRRIVEGLARECLADGAQIEASVFYGQCRARLGRWLVDRLHFKPAEMLVRKALGLDRAGVLARQEAVFRCCESQLGQWLDEAQASATGRLPPPPALPVATVDINSLAGLEEALV